MLQNFFQKISALEKHLLLNVTAKETDIRDTIKRFSGLKPSSLLFTRLDETDAYGTILNQAFGCGIGLSYVTDGQQVPENLLSATPERLAALFVNPLSTAARPLETCDAGRPPMFPEVVRSSRFREYYVANANSDVFHRPGCRWAQKIKADNKLVFDSCREARLQEFKACSLCRPERNSQPPAQTDSKPKIKIGNYNY